MHPCATQAGLTVQVYINHYGLTVRLSFQMPPKKKDVAEEKPVLIGRLGTNLRCGIVGLPNVGKSTFFNVLTKTQMAAAENFPFCTIDPNENKYQF